MSRVQETAAMGICSLWLAVRSRTRILPVERVAVHPGSLDEGPEYQEADCADLFGVRPFWAQLILDSHPSQLRSSVSAIELLCEVLSGSH